MKYWKIKLSNSVLYARAYSLMEAVAKYNIKSYAYAIQIPEYQYVKTIVSHY